MSVCQVPGLRFGSEHRRNVVTAVQDVHDFDRAVVYAVEDDVGVDENLTYTRKQIVSHSACEGIQLQRVSTLFDLAHLCIGNCPRGVLIEIDPDISQIAPGCWRPDQPTARSRHGCGAFAG